jgi:YidC/Oxa1 family membrane protein insertase
MDQKNVLVAIVLSAIVLIVWQYFVGIPQIEKQRQEAQQQAQQRTQQQQSVPPAQTAPGQPQAPGSTPQLPGQGGAPTIGAQMTREAVIAASPRIRIETPRLNGSISLKGARIDDLALIQFRETVDPKSPPIVLLSPFGSPHPFYAEFGWLGAAGANVSLANQETVWRQEGGGALGIGRPVTLVADNGAGLEFRRTIAVDDKYLFTVDDQVVNKTEAPVQLYPYALISRHGTPQTLGYVILHEGLIGVLDDKLQEKTYKELEDKKLFDFATNTGPPPCCPIPRPRSMPVLPTAR